MAIDLFQHRIRVRALASGWFKTELNDAVFDSPAGLEKIARMPARRLGWLGELGRALNPTDRLDRNTITDQKAIVQLSDQKTFG